MSYSAVITETIVMDGVTTTKVGNIVTDGRAGRAPVSVAAAKAGVTASGVGTTTGSLTMSGGHGFTDADIIDVYWAGGSRQSVLIGTVSVNTIPISGGTGDNLPANGTVISAMLPVPETEVFDGDDVQLLVCSSPVPGTITFLEDDGTTLIVAIPLVADDSGTTKYVYTWYAGKGTNPLAAGDVGVIAFSHNSLSAQTTMRVEVRKA